MARKETTTTTTTLVNPGRITLTDAQRKCEELVVRVNLNTRPVTVGVVDVEKTIPRQWYGYAYLLHKNSIVQIVTLDFENKTIFRNRMLWPAEIPIQVATQLINVPNAEPGTVTEQTAVFNLLTSSENFGAYYFPFPQPIDEIEFWFPAGVSIDVIFDVRAWSDILNPDGSIAIPTLPNVEEDDLLELPELGTNDPGLTFADACQQTFPDNWGSDTPEKWRIRFITRIDSTEYVRTFSVNSRFAPGLVGVPESGTANFPSSPYWPNQVADLSCSELTPVTRTTLGAQSNVKWTRQLVEVGSEQAYVVQLAGQQVGSTSIDYDSFTFERCT